MSTTKKARMGRPPLPKNEKGQRVDLYLRASAVEALNELADKGERSAFVSDLLDEALAKKRRKKPK